MAEITETSRIADQLHRSYLGPAWHGPSLNELLAGITEEQASRRPIPDAHTIWEIILHVTAWIRIARERLTDRSVRQVADDENWPAVTGSWSDALTALNRDVQALEEAIRAFPDDKLNRRAPAVEAQSYYGLMHGVVQHNLYHAGQIALLKKQPTSSEVSRAGQPA
jgi:uncharacterized damage-inducible protein DinB